MKKHIQQFEIKSYRGIRNLMLDNLNVINILTGNNNSGKTSVLELVSTLNNPQYIDSWIPCARFHKVNLGSSIAYEGFYDLFPVYDAKKKVAYDFVDFDGLNHFVDLHSAIGKTQISKEQLNELNGFKSNTYDENSNVLMDTLYLDLKVNIDNEEASEGRIYERQALIPRVLTNEYKFVKTIYLTPTFYAENEFDLSPILSNPALYEKMIQILRTFDPDIINISALRDELTHLDAYKILTRNSSYALPLDAYGDGIRKTIFLLNALVQAQNGILLIDEFEIGIHTSAMNNIFACLLRSALELNVQIFMTSHNKEAIDKVLRCDENLQPYINLYTMYNNAGINCARLLKCKEAIKAQDTLGLELR